MLIDGRAIGTNEVAVSAVDNVRRRLVGIFVLTLFGGASLSRTGSSARNGGAFAYAACGRGRMRGWSGRS
jgi:hypothetical protein